MCARHNRANRSIPAGRQRLDAKRRFARLPACLALSPQLAPNSLLHSRQGDLARIRLRLSRFFFLRWLLCGFLHRIRMTCAKGAVNGPEFQTLPLPVQCHMGLRPRKTRQKQLRRDCNRNHAAWISRTFRPEVVQRTGPRFRANAVTQRTRRGRRLSNPKAMPPITIRLPGSGTLGDVLAGTVFSWITRSW
jgi:hypothetical protein